MARPRKPPAVLVEAIVGKSAKLAALPSDTARLGFFYVVLGEAKLSEPVPGQFASVAHFKAVAGRFARYLDEYLRVGVLELAPKTCPRCKLRWQAMPPKGGVLLVHDWHEHQYDPRKIERQREYEDHQREAVSDGVSDAHSDVVSDGVSDANPTAISHAHVAEARRDRVVNVEPRTLNESLNGENPDARAGERADIAALRDRGWKRVTKPQRKVLDEVLERHDVTGPEFAASAIRATPADKDPLAAVMTADRLWQEAQRHQADVEESGWQATKAAERVEATGRIAWLEEQS